MSKDVSILMANGHQDARAYPIGRLDFEVSLIQERMNGYFATQAVLIQQAISANIAADGGKLFQKTIESLTNV